MVCRERKKTIYNISKLRNENMKFYVMEYKIYMDELRFNSVWINKTRVIGNQKDGLTSTAI